MVCIDSLRPYIDWAGKDHISDPERYILGVTLVSTSREGEVTLVQGYMDVTIADFTGAEGVFHVRLRGAGMRSLVTVQRQLQAFPVTRRPGRLPDDYDIVDERMRVVIQIDIKDTGSQVRVGDSVRREIVDNFMLECGDGFLYGVSDTHAYVLSLQQIERTASGWVLDGRQVVEDTLPETSPFVPPADTAFDAAVFAADAADAVVEAPPAPEATAIDDAFEPAPAADAVPEPAAEPEDPWAEATVAAVATGEAGMELVDEGTWPSDAAYDASAGPIASAVDESGWVDSPAEIMDAVQSDVDAWVAGAADATVIDAGEAAEEVTDWAESIADGSLAFQDDVDAWAQEIGDDGQAWADVATDDGDSWAEALSQAPTMEEPGAFDEAASVADAAFLEAPAQPAADVEVTDWAEALFDESPGGDGDLNDALAEWLNDTDAEPGGVPAEPAPAESEAGVIDWLADDTPDVQGAVQDVLDSLDGAWDDLLDDDETTR
jgi:hypothetical protein